MMDLSMPKALGQIKQIKNIQQGFYDNFFNHLEPDNKKTIELFFKHMKAPLEVAVLPQTNGQPFLLLLLTFQI